MQYKLFFFLLLAILTEEIFKESLPGGVFKNFTNTNKQYVENLTHVE